MKVVVLCLMMAAGGCGVSTAVSHGHNTALDAIDLETMTEQMARSIAGDAEVQAAYAKSGPLKIVVQPVENRLTGEILPTGQAEMFTARVRSLLANQDRERYVWVMNRDVFYRLREKELDIDLGPAPDRIQPEFALAAIFSSLAHESSKQRSAAYLCEYELTNLKSGTVLWSDKYEVKKTAVKGFLD